MPRSTARISPIVLGGLALFALPLAASAADADAEQIAAIEAAIAAAPVEEPYESPTHLQPCIDGMSMGIYPCDGIDLLEFMAVGTFGATGTNSGWGWTDPLDGTEYYLLGLNNGTAFIDISDPENPVYVGKLPAHNGTSSLWRDVRVYANHAYIVSESSGHGMQVFDLTQLRNPPPPLPRTFTETAHYNKVSNTHTISINEETGYAYLVGTTGTGGNPEVVTCGGNIHVVNLANPTVPVHVGCYNDGGYVHENQCFVYHGPDTSCDHDDDPGTPEVNCQGLELCLAARGSAHDLDIVNVTNHALPKRISSLQYNSSGYSHQAWFTEDHRFILLNDELDEDNLGHPTRTWIFDALDLDAPILAGATGYYQHATSSIDHNLYVAGNYVTESNYSAGLRILDLDGVATATLEPAAFFDVYPASDVTDFVGTWNHYPFFASGVIPVTHIQQGLFLLKPSQICLQAPAAPTGLVASPNGANRIDLDWTGSGEPGATWRVERAPGGCGGTFAVVADDLASPSFDDLTASGGVLYGYRVRELTNEGACASLVSSCVTATTSGACTEPPTFAGVESATDAGLPGCRVDLDWSAATNWCGGPARYAVYRGISEGFMPSPANRIAQGLVATAYSDLAAPATTAYYVVRATDLASGAEEQNLARAAATATGPPADGTFATGAEIGDPTLDTGGGFGESPEHAGWHISDARSHLGDRSFWSTQADNLCVTLEGAFALTAGQSSTLSFWTAWDIETGWDGGVLDLSTNGGTSWTRLTPVGGYPGTITNGGSLCGIAVGSGAFTGENNLDVVPFVAKSVNLAAWSGQDIRLRFLYRTDSFQTGEGWYVDDLSITHAQVPTVCATPWIFADDFEAGNTSLWSEIFPPQP